MLVKRKAKRIQVKPEKMALPPPVTQQGFGIEMPPQKQLVDIYFDQKGFADQAPLFFQFYEQLNWSSPRGTPYRNWKMLAVEWIFDHQQALKLTRRRRINAAL